VSFGQFKGRIIPIYLLVIMLSFTFVPILLLNHGTAHAVDGQVQSRSIQMGDSTLLLAAAQLFIKLLSLRIMSVQPRSTELLLTFCINQTQSLR